MGKSGMTPKIKIKKKSASKCRAGLYDGVLGPLLVKKDL